MFLERGHLITLIQPDRIVLQGDADLDARPVGGGDQRHDLHRRGLGVGDRPRILPGQPAEPPAAAGQDFHPQAPAARPDAAEPERHARPQAEQRAWIAALAAAGDEAVQNHLGPRIA